MQFCFHDVVSVGFYQKLTRCLSSEEQNRERLCGTQMKRCPGAAGGNTSVVQNGCDLLQWPCRGRDGPVESGGSDVHCCLAASSAAHSSTQYWSNHPDLKSKYEVWCYRSFLWERLNQPETPSVWSQFDWSLLLRLQRTCRVRCIAQDRRRNNTTAQLTSFFRAAGDEQ